MCGIFGIMSYKVEKDYRQTQETAIRIIGTEILQLLEDRGGDATGVAALFEDCNYMGLKMGVAATEFLSRFGNEKESYEGWIDIMKKKESPTKMFIGHCRKSSVGNSIDNMNNHPIHIKNKIVGIHNGTLTNHDAIFHNLKCERDGTVDSEAIFRLLYHFLNEGNDPFTKEAIQETCKRIHGNYSVITFNATNPNQIAVFRDGRPLAFALIKKLNILLIASEEKYIKHSIFKYNKLSALYKIEGDFCRLTKKDVSFETLNDDSIAIFDNRIEITEDMEIKDLIDSVKIPRTEKVWKNKIIEEIETEKAEEAEKIEEAKKTKNDITVGNAADSYYDNYSYVYNNNRNKHYVNKYKSQKTIIDENNNKKETCMLWIKKFEKLTLIKNDENVDGLLSIEIDTIQNQVFEVKNFSKILLNKYSITGETLLLEKTVEEDKVITLVEDSQKEVLSGTGKTILYINNKLHNEENTPIEATVVENTVITEKDKASSITIDVSKNTKAIELSEITSKYTMKRYSNDDEAMEAIDIVDKNIIKAMPFYSLCNRIKRFAFKDGFYNGYTTRIKEENEEIEETEDFNKLKIKKNKAEKKIRVLKTLSKVLDRVLYSCTKYNIFSIGEDLTTIIKNKQEIDSQTLRSIYSDRDLKDNASIGKITTLLELTKNKEID